MNDIEKAIEDLNKLRKKCSVRTNMFKEMHGEHLDTAISALEKQKSSGWIPVSEILPQNEERVLICTNRKRFDGKVIQIRTTAMYEDGTMCTNDSGFCWEDSNFDYNEEADDYIIPEGWYEQNMYCEVFGVVDDFVIAWQPLPEPFKEAANV